jgi:hypothetical protein
VLFEPFAIVASIWYTQRAMSRNDESLTNVMTCWAAVLVHSATLAFYLRTGWR